MSRITAKMTADEIQKIFNKGGYISIAKGDYYIKQTIYIRSDTEVDCEDGVCFHKMCSPSMIMTYVTEKTTKYKGAHGIKWRGGEIISDVKSKTQSNLCTIVHAQDVEITGLKVRRSYSPHCIEINSSKDVTIRGCEFRTHVPPKDYKEVIQIDFANFAGLTYAAADAPTYDGTHCEGVTITECSFINCGHAIGTHTVSAEDKAHKKIKVYNCEYNGEGIFLKLLNMRDVEISNNDILNAKVGIKLNVMSNEVLSHGGKVKVEIGKRNRNVVIGNNVYRFCQAEIESI